MPAAGKATGVANPSPKKTLLDFKPTLDAAKTEAPKLVYVAPSPIKALPPTIPKIVVNQPSGPVSGGPTAQTSNLQSKFVHSHAHSSTNIKNANKSSDECSHAHPAAPQQPPSQAVQILTGAQ